MILDRDYINPYTKDIFKKGEKVIAQSQSEDGGGPQYNKLPDGYGNWTEWMWHQGVVSEEEIIFPQSKKEESDSIEIRME